MPLDSTRHISFTSLYTSRLACAGVPGQVLFHWPISAWMCFCALGFNAQLEKTKPNKKRGKKRKITRLNSPTNCFQCKWHPQALKSSVTLLENWTQLHWRVWFTKWKLLLVHFLTCSFPLAHNARLIELFTQMMAAWCLLLGQQVQSGRQALIKL